MSEQYKVQQTIKYSKFQYREWLYRKLLFYMVNFILSQALQARSAEQEIAIQQLRAHLQENVYVYDENCGQFRVRFNH